MREKEIKPAAIVETSDGGGGRGGGGAAGGAAVVVVVGGGSSSSSRTEAEEVELYRRHRRHGHLRDRCCLLAEGERRETAASAVGLNFEDVPQPCPDYKLMTTDKAIAVQVVHVCIATESSLICCGFLPRGTAGMNTQDKTMTTIEPRENDRSLSTHKKHMT